MTLTALRRVVLVLDIAAVAAAGACAWYALQAKPAAARDWPKLFPVKNTAASEAADIAPKDVFTAAITWPQGDKPVEVKPDNTPPPPPVDPVKTQYKLNGILLSRNPFNSYAQLALTEGEDKRGFSVGVGERIPVDPATLQSPPQLTPWRLQSVKDGGWDAKGQPLPCTATFQNVDSLKEQVLEMLAGNKVALDNPNELKGPGIGTEDPSGKRPKDQPMRAVLIRADLAAGVMEWDVPEPEVAFLGDWAGDQAKLISTVASKDASGQPDGFTLKSIQQGSRAAEYGFKPEDKVISVNSQPVNSVEDAVSKGRAQYDNGATVFQVKALRAGKELNFTFHAPPPKKRRARQ